MLKLIVNVIIGAVDVVFIIFLFLYFGVMVYIFATDFIDFVGNVIEKRKRRKKMIQIMSLINAEALMDNLHDGIFEDAELKADYELLGIDDYIKNQPAAYDVDAVVNEIKKSTTDRDGLMIYDGDEQMIHKSIAIDIIKRGGIDDRD